MSTRPYVTAVVTALHNGIPLQEVLAGLRKTLSSRGRMKLQKRILHEVIGRLESEGAGTATVILASKESEKKWKKAIAESLQDLGTDTEANVITDDSIIGGYILRYDHRRIDKSYKKALLELYTRALRHTNGNQ